MADKLQKVTLTSEAQKGYQAPAAPPPVPLREGYSAPAAPPSAVPPSKTPISIVPPPPASK
jgi:hypothetical protein